MRAGCGAPPAFGVGLPKRTAGADQAGQAACAGVPRAPAMPAPPPPTRLLPTCSCPRSRQGHLGHPSRGAAVCGPGSGAGDPDHRHQGGQAWPLEQQPVAAPPAGPPSARWHCLHPRHSSAPRHGVAVLVGAGAGRLAVEAPGGRRGRAPPCQPRCPASKPGCPPPTPRPLCSSSSPLLHLRLATGGGPAGALPEGRQDRAVWRRGRGQDRAHHGADQQRGQGAR